MKIKNILIIVLLSIVSVVNAQNDTLYLYKNGSATLVSAVSGIDSMVVRRPTTTDTLFFYRSGKIIQKNARLVKKLNYLTNLLVSTIKNVKIAVQKEII